MGTWVVLLIKNPAEIPELMRSPTSKVPSHSFWRVRNRSKSQAEEREKDFEDSW